MYARTGRMSGLVALVAILSCAVLVACGGAGGEPVAKASGAPKSIPVADGADPYALLADIRDAHAADRDGRAARLDDVSRTWRGKRVRWELGVLRPLCPNASGCAALPFDQARLDEPSGQGWLPRLELEPEEHARIVAACEEQPLCVVEVEATVSRVRLSTELPTAVTLAEARMLSARGPAAAESWVRYPAPAWQAGTSRAASASGSTASSERSAVAAWAPSTRRSKRTSTVASR